MGCHELCWNCRETKKLSQSVIGKIQAITLLFVSIDQRAVPSTKKLETLMSGRLHCSACGRKPNAYDYLALHQPQPWSMLYLTGYLTKVFSGITRMIRQRMACPISGMWKIKEIPQNDSLSNGSMTAPGNGIERPVSRGPNVTARVL